MKISDALIILGVAGIAVFATSRYVKQQDLPPMPVGSKGPFGNWLDGLWPDSHLYADNPDYDPVDPEDSPVVPTRSPTGEFWDDHVAGNKAGVVLGGLLGGGLAIALAVPSGGASLTTIGASTALGAAAGSALEDTIEKHKPWKGWLPFV